MAEHKPSEFVVGLRERALAKLKRIKNDLKAIEKLFEGSSDLVEREYKKITDNLELVAKDSARRVDRAHRVVELYNTEFENAAEEDRYYAMEDAHAAVRVKDEKAKLSAAEKSPFISKKPTSSAPLVQPATHPPKSFGVSPSTKYGNVTANNGSPSSGIGGKHAVTYVSPYATANPQQAQARSALVVKPTIDLTKGDKKQPGSADAHKAQATGQKRKAPADLSNVRWDEAMRRDFRR